MRLHCIFLSVLLPSSSFGAAYSVLTIGSLGSPNAIDPGYGLFLNNSGEVAGTYHSFLSGATGATEQGFRTQPNSQFDASIDDIGAPPPQNASGFLAAVLGMNNFGQLIVNSDIGWLLTDSSGKINGNGQNLSAFPSFLNDRGQIAGTAIFGNTAIAYRTQPGKPYDAATDNLGSFNVRSLNNLGQVLGDADATGTSFLTPPDGPQNGGTLGANFFGEAVNDSGEVGGFVIQSDGSTHAFVTLPDEGYPNGTDFSTLGGRLANIRSLNNQGVAVGFSDLANGSEVAFITINGSMTDLNTLIDPSLGLILGDAPRINDNGQILALAHNTNDGTDSVVLLTPIPEPTSLTLVGISGVLLLRRQRR